MPVKPRLCPPMGCVCLGQPGVWAVAQGVCPLSPLPPCGHAQALPPGQGRPRGRKALTPLPGTGRGSARSSVLDVRVPLWPPLEKGTSPSIRNKWSPLPTQAVRKSGHVSFSGTSSESCYCCWVLILSVGLNSRCVVSVGPSLDGSLPRSSLG